MPVRIWRLWAKSLGEKASDSDSTTPYSAMIPNRTPLESAFL